MTRRERMRRAVAYLKHYVDTYDKQTGYEDYADETLIEDVLYGLGVALDPWKFQYANGHSAFKEWLLGYLQKPKTRPPTGCLQTWAETAA